MGERLTRREVREGAFIILFQTMFGYTPEEAAEVSVESFGLAKNGQTDELVRGVLEHSEELEAIIGKYSRTRAVPRIAKVNLTILKIALYEMKYNDRVPPAAAINEAVELAKKYAMKNDSGFINGILNSYLGELDAEQE
ncbi:MAG: transcription antitermination factor NusB [Oscillospiraceae bacterium]